MTKHIREMVSASGIENVSRRGVLKGILATGSFVLAVHVVRRWPTTPPNGAETACRMAP